MRAIHTFNLFVKIAVVAVIELRVSLTRVTHVFDASIEITRVLDSLIIKETSEITDVNRIPLATGFSFLAVYPDTGETLVSVPQYFFQILHLTPLLIVWIDINLHTLDKGYADFGFIDILQCFSDIDLEIIIHIIDVGMVQCKQFLGLRRVIGI